MEFTNADVESLADKLAAMDLTDGEWEALRTMAALSAAALPGDDEVSGFGYEAVTLERGAIDVRLAVAEARPADGFLPGATRVGRQHPQRHDGAGIAEHLSRPVDRPEVAPSRTTCSETRLQGIGR